MTEKTRQSTHDRSRHRLCPACGTRTRLYALKDGRKKCGACGKKFVAERKSSQRKLQQYADILLCFALDFPAQQATKLTQHPYRTVLRLYAAFREILAEQNLLPGKIRLIMETERCDRNVHDSAFCARCKGRFSCRGRKSGDAPVFGIKLLENGHVFIDPLQDDEASFRFDRAASAQSHSRFSGYSGFICRGNFHRFADQEHTRDGAEQLWSWMSERLQRHHGIWKRNAGFYLKELEWKYNHRSLPPEAQAMKIAELLPADFLQRKEAISVRKQA